MAAGTQQQTLLDQINDATNKQALALTRQGVAVASIATNQRTLATELDGLILKLQGSGVEDPEIIAALQQQSARSSQMADALEAQASTLEDQATFSAALASKGEIDVVPAVIPEAPPVSAGTGAPLPPVGLG